MACYSVFGLAATLFTKQLNLDRLKGGTWEYNEEQQIKLEKKITFEGEIEAITIYETDVKWRKL